MKNFLHHNQGEEASKRVNMTYDAFVCIKDEACDQVTWDTKKTCQTKT